MSFKLTSYAVSGVIEWKFFKNLANGASTNAWTLASSLSNALVSLGIFEEKSGSRRGQRVWMRSGKGEALLTLFLSSLESTAVKAEATKAASSSGRLTMPTGCTASVSASVMSSSSPSSKSAHSGRSGGESGPGSSAQLVRSARDCRSLLGWRERSGTF